MKVEFWGIILRHILGHFFRDKAKFVGIDLRYFGGAYLKPQGYLGGIILRHNFWHSLDTKQIWGQKLKAFSKTYSRAQGIFKGHNIKAYNRYFVLRHIFLGHKSKA